MRILLNSERKSSRVSLGTVDMRLGLYFKHVLGYRLNTAGVVDLDSEVHAQIKHRSFENMRQREKRQHRVVGFDLQECTWLRARSKVIFE